MIFATDIVLQFSPFILIVVINTCRYLSDKYNFISTFISFARNLELKNGLELKCLHFFLIHFKIMQ